MQAIIVFVSDSVRQQVRPPCMRICCPRIISTGSQPPNRSARAKRCGRVPTHLHLLFEPGGALGELNPGEPRRLTQKAMVLTEVFQRSNSNVVWHHGHLSFRHHELRGLDHPRKRLGLQVVHHFLLARRDGTTAAERIFGQKSRSMFAAILVSVEPPTPISPPRRALG
jgi:hypothetical protein